MPKFAANLSMLFTELDFLERFAAARDAGFKGVEYLFPYAYAPDELAERLAANGLTQVLHNLPGGDWDAGERGIAALPGRVGEFQDSVATAIEYAHALGCKQLNCLAGIPPEDADPDIVRETLVDNLRFAAGKLEEAGIRLLVEAINTRDIPGFYVTSTDQTLELIKAAACGNIAVQYDIYHMQIMEGDLAPTMEANLSSIEHIQLADNPGRHEPGTGEINYPFLFDFLDRLGYQGWIGCEYKPLAGTSEGLGWLRPYF